MFIFSYDVHRHAKKMLLSDVDLGIFSRFDGSLALSYCMVILEELSKGVVLSSIPVSWDEDTLFLRLSLFLRMKGHSIDCAERKVSFFRLSKKSPGCVFGCPCFPVSIKKKRK